MVGVLVGALPRAPLAGPAGGKDPKAALGAKALEILYSAMLNDDSDIRVLAAEQWGPIGNRASARVLKRALKDRNANVRIAAAGSLYQLGDKSGVVEVEKIVEAAPDPPEEGASLSAVQELRYIARNKVRVVASRALGRMAEPSSVKVLEGALSDRDGAVRDAAAVALARLGSDREMGSIMDAVGSDNTQIRVKAARALGEVASVSAAPEAVRYLKALAKDPSHQVRAAAMEALGESGSVLGIEELSAGAEDQNELVRSKAVAAMGRLGAGGAVQHLEKARRTSANVFIELLAIAGLARAGEKVDLSAARRALYQHDVDTRVLAVEVLETVGGDAAIEELESALDDREMRVRVRAAAALVNLLQRAGGSRKK
ncbi:MAG: HEAT repeat domain-containing protein [Elusimicrobiota bacterium]